MADIRINSLPSTATSFNTDDYIAIDGASGGTRKMLAANPPFSDVTLGTSGPSVKSTLSARAPRQGLVFDGTAGATVSGVPAFGTRDFTVAAWVNPTSLSNNNTIFASGVATAGPIFRILTSGAVSLINGDSTQTISSSGVISAGKSSFVVYSRTGGTGAFYINGIASGSGPDSYNFSSSITEVGALAAIYERFKGYVSGLIYNRALSASEVVALYEAGAPAGADYGQGTNDSGATVYSGQQMVNGDNSTFASDTGWWTKASGVSITGGKLVLSSVATGSAAILRNSVLKIGIRYRVTFTISNYSAGGVKIQFGGTSGTTRTANGTYTEEVVCGSSNTNLYPLVTVGTTTLDVDDLTVTPSGLLLAPDAAQAGGGLVWYDTSGNAANITLPASGVSWNVPSSRYLGGNWTTSGNLTVSGTGTSSVAGKLQLGATTATGYNTLLESSGITTGRGVYQITSTGAWLIAGIEASVGGTSLTGSTAYASYLGSFTNTPLHLVSNSTIGATLTNGGNYLIGTTIDNSATFASNRTGTGPASSGAISTAAIRAVDVSNDLALDIGVNSAASPYPGWIQVHGRTNQATNYPLALNPNGGVVLVNTSANSGNGAVQLATHTTSAGGIGFGSDTALYRTATGILQVDSLSGNNPTLKLAQAGVQKVWMEYYAPDTKGYITTADSLAIRTNGGTTALTLDNSQNATFAGNYVRINSTADAYFVANGTSASSSASYQFLKAGTQKWSLTSKATNHDLGFYNNGGINAFALTLEYSTGDATFAGQALSSVNAANATNFGNFVASNATLNAFVSYTSGASLDQKYWVWQSGSAVGDGVFRLRAINDGNTNGKNAIVVKRTGISSVIVNLPSLPTSSAGLAAGDLWNDSGTVKVV